MSPNYLTAFPRLYAVHPFMPLAPLLSWYDRFDWSDDEAVVTFALTVLERQSYAAERELDWLTEIADAAILDLNDLLAAAADSDQRAQRSILFLRFLFSILPMEKMLALGRRGPAYDWTFRGLSSSYDPDRRHNAGSVYLPFRLASDPRIGVVATRWLARWCLNFFLIARDAGIRDEVPATFNVCWDVLLEILELDGDDPQLKIELFFGLASMASWAVHADYARRDEWVSWLVEAWTAGDVPTNAASVVAAVFITRAFPVTGKSAREWAIEVLAKLGSTLREHERLQFLVASIATHEQWVGARDEILAEIRTLNERADGAEALGSSALFARDARLDVVKPLIRLLILEQDVAGAMDVLRAWYKVPGTVPCDDNVLFVHPAIGDGVAVVWPGRARISLNTTSTGHEVVVDALQEALGIAFDEDAPVIDERREGIPIYARGAQVEAAMLAYYRPAEIAAQFRRIADPRSLVVFPSVADPLQALLARDLGIMLPLEVSLAQAQPDRPIRRISIWAGDTYFTQYEVDALQTLAARRGWEVDVFAGSEDGDAAEFRAFYRQSRPDVLWVAGHGEFVAHRLHDTGIVVGNPRLEREDGYVGNTILPMEELAALPVPGKDRRLLVLNTCNGATTQGMAGMARIGLAQSLVRPNQAVAGHLWPASSALALGFGVLLAGFLDGRSVLGAFAETLTTLREPDRIVETIEEQLGRPFDGRERIASSRDELASIMAWGCPVLLT